MFSKTEIILPKYLVSGQLMKLPSIAVGKRRKALNFHFCDAIN